MPNETDAERLKLVREARVIVPSILYPDGAYAIYNYHERKRVVDACMAVADALESAVAEKQTAIEAVRVSKAGTTLAVIVERDRVLAEKQAAEEERDEAIAKLGSVSNGYLRLNNQVAHLTVENADRDTLARANADVLEQNRVLREALERAKLLCNDDDAANASTVCYDALRSTAPARQSGGDNE